MAAILKYYTSEKVYRETEGVDDSIYYVGTTADIKAMYKSIARNLNTDIKPYFCESPKFSESRQVYALCIDKDGWMIIINSDTMLSFIISGEVILA